MQDQEEKQKGRKTEGEVTLNTSKATHQKYHAANQEKLPSWTNDPQDPQHGDEERQIPVFLSTEIFACPHSHIVIDVDGRPKQRVAYIIKCWQAHIHATKITT